MLKLKIALLGLAILANSLKAYAQIRYEPAATAIVSTREGRLQGAEPAPGIRAYLGIPYAKPPVGLLRWQPPQSYPSWKGLRPAVAHGSPCAQQRFGWNNNSADHGTEDCLFLNVWAPAAGSKHAVMVYIHGGSNLAGSAAEELSNGLALVPKGVVLVTFDYRLGIFGFFRSAALDEESPRHTSGDYGLLDQIAALEWVKRNIAHFGGDPANVTIFGQSAGAVDTGLLMVSPLARGLFVRALEESGQVAGLMRTATKAQSEDAWASVAQSLGTRPSTMRSASTDEVLAAEKSAPKPPPENFWGYRSASVDGWVLPDLPATLFAQGREAPVPLLIGSNVQEIVPHDQSPDWTKHLIEAAVGSAAASQLEAIYSQPPGNLLEGDAGARFQTDRDFRCAVRQVAAWHSAHGFPTYVYQFDRSAASEKPAQHSSELRYVFGFPASVPHSEADSAVSETIQTYWTNFAKTGDPMSGELPQWGRFLADKGNYLHFASAKAEPVAAYDLGGPSCTILSSTALPGAH
ncbi:para-nitrobenzyl esterase [Granulicella aggregans]|uniref:Carboxylic ester hydrolase n=1 Tax=Granulicella aggregans TaxID=474949 RepID=A0A7W7ZDU4_9BACT|nr:carboxylesterase family protein [Granulicella aggregans]MBB5057957.1 para-nitrobenzyl esterase [Granulicella aggregans]